MSPSPARTPVLVALAAVGVLAGGVHHVSSSSAEGVDRPADRSSEQRSARVTATTSRAAGELYPGGVVTGSLLLSSAGREPVEVTSAFFEQATTTTPGCGTTGVAFASTVEASATAPLVVPAGAGGSGPVAPLGWTAFLSMDADDACQGASFRSTLVVDGERVATVTVAAGSLPAPGAPFGVLTASTRAGLAWAAAPAPSTTVAHVVERAPAGTSAWSPACGTSTAAPVRTPACTDTGLSPDTAYAYRVTSVLGAWRAVSRTSHEVRTRPAPRG